jgi:hypothetical protein
MFLARAQLTQYEMFAGDAGFINKKVQQIWR